MPITLSPKQRARFWFDLAVSLVALVALVVPMSYLPEVSRSLISVLLSGLMVLSLAVRRVAPFVAFGICVAAGFGMMLWLSFPVPALIVVLPITYSVSRYRQEPLALIALIIGLLAALVGPLTWLPSITQEGRFAVGSLLVLACVAAITTSYLLGVVLRDRKRLEQLTDELIEERFFAKEQRTQQNSELASGKARVEVARELHDVVAHSLSVIVVQAEGAKAIAAKSPESTREALDVIAVTGRESIEEMRRIVGVLRGENNATFGPTPSLPQISEMVEKAGERVELKMVGDCLPVPDSLGLTAYRVVQESVTNFLKYAGPTAKANVVVECVADKIRIRVSDDGIGPQSEADTGGTGIRGMRERVAAMGGEFRAGPRVGGGFEVRAELPLPSALGRGWLKQ